MPTTGFATSRRTDLPVTGSGVNSFSGRQEWAQGSDIASAATIALPTDGNLFLVTGSTQIDNISGGQAGTRISLWFQGTVTLGAAGNVTPRGGSRNTTAGEVIEFEARDNGGIEWLEKGTTSLAAGLGPNEITTVDAGIAGGERASIDGTVGADATDIQAGRAAATAATGNVALAGQPNDGDTVILNDGVNPAVTFEFDNNASVVETSTLRQVVIGATAGDTIANFITAVGVATIDITAIAGAGDSADLTADTDGSTANREILGTDTAGVQTRTGMTGGRISVAVGAESVAVGSNVSAESTYGVAIGSDAQTSATNVGGIAIGRNANARGDLGNMAIGYNATVDPTLQAAPLSNGGALAIGLGATAGDDGQVIIGRDATGGSYAQDGTDAIAIGHAAKAYSEISIAIGHNAYVPTQPFPYRGGIAIGYSASADRTGVALGFNADSSGKGVCVGNNATGAGIAIGNGTAATDSDSICIGNSSSISGTQSVCLGRNSGNALDRTVAIGPNVVLTAHYTIGIGSQAAAGADSAIAIGRQADVNNAGNIGIGASCVSSGDNAVVIGSNAKNYNNNSVFIGDGINSGGVTVAGSDVGVDASMTCIGRNLSFDADSHTSLLIGHDLAVNRERCVLLGNSIAVTPTNGPTYVKQTVAIGNGIEFGNRSVIIGGGAKIDIRAAYAGSNTDGCVAIGYNATAFPGATCLGGSALSRGCFNAGGNNGGNASGFAGYGCSINIGVQTYGFRSIGLGTVNNRIESFKVGATPITGFSYTSGTNGGGVHRSYYGSGMSAVITQGPINMVAAYTGPVRRFWAFDTYNSFFIDDLSLVSSAFSGLTTHGNVSVTGLQRTATATTTTATSTAGTGVTLSVASSAGFSIGDWILATSGTLGTVNERIRGVAKVTGTGAGTITIDLQAENDFNSVIGTNIVLLSGADGNVLASTQLTTLSDVNQRESMVSAQTQGYDVIVVTREAAATATTMELIPTMRGVMQEMQGAWSYSFPP